MKTFTSKPAAAKNEENFRFSFNRNLRATEDSKSLRAWKKRIRNMPPGTWYQTQWKPPPADNAKSLRPGAFLLVAEGGLHLSLNPF